MVQIDSQHLEAHTIIWDLRIIQTILSSNSLRIKSIYGDKSGKIFHTTKYSKILKIFTTLNNI